MKEDPNFKEIGDFAKKNNIEIIASSEDTFCKNSNFVLEYTIGVTFLRIKAKWPNYFASSSAVPTFKKIVDINGMKEDSEEIVIKFEDNSSLVLYHEFDCCERVSVAQVDSDPDRFIGSKFVELKVKTNNEDDNSPDFYTDSFTWTFYTLVTSKGYLDFCWLGTSNGYYPSVDLSPNLGKTKLL